MIPGILFPSPRTAGLPVQPVQLYGMRVSHTESRPGSCLGRAPHAALRLPRFSVDLDPLVWRTTDLPKPGRTPSQGGLPCTQCRPEANLWPPQVQGNAAPGNPSTPTPSAQRRRRVMATRCRHSTSSARGEEVRCVTARHHTDDIRNQRDSGRESRAGSGVLPPDRAGAPTVRNAGRTRDRRRPVGVPSDHERPARPRRRPG